VAASFGFRDRLRYKYEEFLGGGAGKQLLFLFGLSLAIVFLHMLVAVALSLSTDEVGEGFGEKFWFFFTRVIDAGTMVGDRSPGVRVVSTIATLLGVVVAGLLISSLSGNFQQRLDDIRRGSSKVVERDHFLILGWSEKIFSVIDQLAEAYAAKGGRIVVVVMAERDKVQMEEALAEKVVYQKRVKIVVRSGSSVSIGDLSKVAFHIARGIIVLVDEADEASPNRADGRIIKTLMAIYNHPDSRGREERMRVTAEVMIAANQELATIASNGRAHVIRTNEIISKIILQTARISGLSLVYDELLRFEGSEVHFSSVPQAVGRTFGSLLLDFPSACLVGVAKSDGTHVLNPPTDHQIAPDEQLMLLAEDEHIPFAAYAGPLRMDQFSPQPQSSDKPVEHMLILGWNEKVFPIVQEFDNYVGAGSSLTMVNSLSQEDREKQFAESCAPFKNTALHHVVGEFSSRALMEHIQPQRYPTVLVLGDGTGDGGAEESDTRAIISLLLLRDYRQRAGIAHQEVCSEILNPKNRELAATTKIHDIVISNEMVSMVLAQITYEPRIRPVLEDFFDADGNEVYLKDLSLYAPLGKPTSFEELILSAKARDEVAMGVQIYTDDPNTRYGLRLNPADRRAVITPKEGDRLVVLAEDDG
jgi:hypothetical protein